MPRIRTPISAGSDCNASRVTNNPHRLPHVDGRSTWARRRRDLVQQILAELQRKPSAREIATVGNIASLQVRLEQMQAAICRGERIDDEELVRLSGVIGRLFATLEPGKASAPSLSDYMAKRAGEAA